MRELEGIVGTDHVRPPEETRFVVDGISPSVVVMPASYDEVAAVMRFANRERLAVIPLGGGTKRNIGNVPSRYDIALSLERLSQVIEHEPADLTVTCQAGISVSDLQTRLGGVGQSVPLDVWLPQRPYVGGMLAANQNGPSRAAYGALRDFTIGMRVIASDGRITRAGGKVVKNVAGYDLCKLYIGSMGTLGIIVEATLKVTPVPKSQRHFLLYVPKLHAACALAAALYRRGLALSYLQLRGTVGESESGDYRSTMWSLEIGLAGSDRAVERSATELDTFASEFGAEPIGGDWPGGPGRFGIGPESDNGVQLVCRFSVLPSKLPIIIGQLHEFGWPDIEAEPGTGTLRAYWHADEDIAAVLNRAREVAAQHMAPCVVEHCSLELKRQIDVFGDPPPAFDLMRRVKQQFDPNGILSPGRFVGRL